MSHARSNRKEDPKNMSTFPIDDLMVGHWVTLRDGLACPAPSSSQITIRISDEQEGAGSDLACESNNQVDTAEVPVAPGIPLRVIAMSLPFVYVAVLEGNGGESGPVILDIRKVELTWLDESVPIAVKRFARGRLR